MVAAGYIIEQSVFGAVYITLVVIFALEIIVERHIKRRNANIRRAEARNPPLERQSSASLRQGQVHTKPFTTALSASNSPSSSGSIVPYALATSKVAPEAHVMRQREITVGKLHYVFHRGCLFASLVNLGRMVDPAAVLGIYTQASLSWFSYVNTSTLCCLGFFSVFLPIDLGYRMLFLSTPRVFPILFGIASSSVVLFACVCALTEQIINQEWTNSLYILVVMVNLLLALIFMHLGIHRLIKQISSLRKDLRQSDRVLAANTSNEIASDDDIDNAGTSSRKNIGTSTRIRLTSSSKYRDSVARTMRSLRIMRFVGTVLAVTVLLLGALELPDSFSTKEYKELDPDDYSDRGLFSVGFLVMQTLMLCLFMWYAWIPLSYIDVGELCRFCSCLWTCFCGTFRNGDSMSAVSDSS